MKKDTKRMRTMMEEIKKRIEADQKILEITYLFVVRLTAGEETSRVGERAIQDEMEP